MNLLANLSSEDKEYVLNLSHHLAYAGMAGELRQLLIDLDFAEYKVSISGTQPLIEDYDLALQPEIHLARPTKIWYLATENAIASFSGDSTFLSCAVTPDGQTIMAGDVLGRTHFLKIEDMCENLTENFLDYIL